MKNYVPFEKLSKREQKRINTEKRGSWNGVNPVTRMTKDKTKYDRNKYRNSVWDM